MRRMVSWILRVDFSLFFFSFFFFSSDNPNSVLLRQGVGVMEESTMTYYQKVLFQSKYLHLTNCVTWDKPLSVSKMASSTALSPRGHVSFHVGFICFHRFLLFLMCCYVYLHRRSQETWFWLLYKAVKPYSSPFLWLSHSTAVEIKQGSYMWDTT